MKLAEVKVKSGRNLVTCLSPDTSNRPSSEAKETSTHAACEHPWIQMIAKPELRKLGRHLLRWYAKQARPLPWRLSRDPYAIWVSEIMLQQTQVQTVIPYWERWMRQFPNVQALAKAPLSKVLKLWEGLGYYSRARNLHQAACLVLESNSGKIPHDLRGWLELPGVGRYTAGAICSIAFNQPAPILDGNAERVLARLSALMLPIKSSSAQKQLWTLTAQLIETASKLEREPEPRCSHFNQALMELGAVICLPRQPRCADCPVSRICQAFQKGLLDQIPVTKPNPIATQRHWIGLVVRRGNRYMVRQRPHQGVNAGLWEFPHLESRPVKELDPLMQRLAGGSIRGLRLWTTLRFSITRYRMILHVYRAEMDVPGAMNDREKVRAGNENSDFGKWLTLKELEKLPFSAAHRRLARMLAKESLPAENGNDGR